MSFFVHAFPSAALGCAVVQPAAGRQTAAVAFVIASVFVHYCLQSEGAE